MNIFVLDYDPIKAAQLNCDKHCIKQILESCQILCIPFHLQGIIAPYKISHKNHPVSLWVRESKANCIWTIKHCEALLNEYTIRYKKIHKSSAVLNWIKEHFDLLKFNKEEMTPFAQAMPDDCRGPCAVEAYRKYYLKHKTHLFSWKTKVPEFVK
jgi:pyrimidine dimer DNA glycosylase